MLDPFKAVKRYLSGPPKVNQKQFADDIGASQSTVSRIKDGHACPTWQQAERIEAIVGVPVSSWIDASKKLEQKRRRGLRAA